MKQEAKRMQQIPPYLFARIEKKIADLKEELFNLRFRLATGQLDNVMQITAVKRDIARAMTALTAKTKA